MYHSSRCLPNQHHGLWGVCPTHPSTAILSSWVHMQLWDRCSEVGLSPKEKLAFIVEHRLIGLTVKLLFDVFVLMSSITYNGSMESPVPLYPTDCPPPYEAVMGQRAVSQVSRFMYLWSVCVCYMSHWWQCWFLSFVFCQGNNVWPSWHWAVWGERNFHCLQWRRWENIFLLQIHLFKLKGGVASNSTPKFQLILKISKYVAEEFGDLVFLFGIVIKCKKKVIIL